MQKPRKVRTIEEVMREFFQKNPHFPPEYHSNIKALVLDVRTELTLAKAEQKVIQENHSLTEKPI